jgi:hypothetical protein
MRGQIGRVAVVAATDLLTPCESQEWLVPRDWNAAKLAGGTSGVNASGGPWDGQSCPCDPVLTDRIVRPTYTSSHGCPTYICSTWL